MKDSELISAIVAYEQGEMSDEETLQFFQYLVNTGRAWEMQGHYGRAAAAYIAAGLIEEPAG